MIESEKAVTTLKRGGLIIIASAGSRNSIWTVGRGRGKGGKVEGVGARGRESKA